MKINPYYRIRHILKIAGLSRLKRGNPQMLQGKKRNQPRKQLPGNNKPDSGSIIDYKA